MIRKVFNYIKKYRTNKFLNSNLKHLEKSNRKYLSFGENCLTDHILNRFKLKSYTTPFSHGRSNVEYILNLENDNYKNFLNLKFIQYEKLNNTQVPRLKVYNKISNSYNELHMNGFEFTHHDLIDNPELIEKFKQRVKDLKKNENKKDLFILYHHRYCEQTDFNMLLLHLNELRNIYSRYQKTELILFTQNLINDKKDRKLEYYTKHNIKVFIFHTENIWGGDDNNLLWAYIDDDLIKKMINKIKNINIA